MTTAAGLRQRFKAVPSDVRHANQSASIRIWRSLSWLERMQATDPVDVEGQFIAGWIAFNALYGQTYRDSRPAPERETWQRFLVKVFKHDRDDRLGRLLAHNQRTVLSLIGEKYLYGLYWTAGQSATAKLDAIVTRTIHHLARGETLPLLLELFERLYVQLFHGASTRGSRLNRETLKRSAAMLGHFLPTIVTAMIENGFDEAWGAVSFPPER